MSNILWKNFHLCFSKIKCLPLAISPPPTIEEDEDLLLSSSPMLSAANNNSSASEALAKNFNSIYSNITSDSTSKSLTSSTTEDFFSSDDDSDSDSIPDFSNIFASERFFFSRPGSSNSIIESPEKPPETDGLVTGSVAVQTYSPDPYADFRRSMQEMVEARELTDVKASWEMLHELLMCYLTLNPKHTHKFIVNAFSDLLISLMSSTSSSSSSTTTNESCRNIKGHDHHCSTTSQRLV